MNQLQQIELNDIEQLQEEQQQRFEITDINSLNWVFRKVSALKAKEKEIKALAEAERERINSWEEAELSSINNSLSFFESLVAEYHAKQLALDPKAKTISTPYGKSKSRKTKEQPDKSDEKAILQHVIDNKMDEYIKPTLKWADLKKTLQIAEVNGEKVVIDENGQVVPGATVKPETITYSLEVE